MPMKPHKGESQSDFMSRCVPEMMGDGKRDQDQAVAICSDIWRESKKAMSEFADTGYQADGKKRFKIDTTNQVRAAWNDLNKAEVIKQYTEAQLLRMRARITMAWRKMISEVGPPNFADAPAMEMLRQQVVLSLKEMDVPEPDTDESHDDYIERCIDEATDDNPDADEDDIEEACQLRWDEYGENSLGVKDIMHKTIATKSSGMEFILSDATEDRFGDVIDPAGWETLQFQRNPIALFNHDKGFPIGTWDGIHINDQAQLRATLKLAPKGTSDRIDEIRKLIDADILRAVSVGFRPLAYEPIKESDNFGVRYTKQELCECSVVSVPANPNALSVAKSLNISRSTLRMVFGEHADNNIVQRSLDVSRGKHADKQRETVTTKSGEHAGSKPENRGQPMLLSQRIQEAEKGLLALQDQLDKHLEGIDDDNPTEEQMVTTEDLTAKIEMKQRHLTSLKNIEKKNGSTAVDVVTSARRSASNGSTPPALLTIIKTLKKPEPIDYFFRAAVVRAKSKSDGLSVDDMRNKIYGDDECTRHVCDLVLKAASAPAETTVPGWAQELVRTIWADFMQVLLPQSIYPRLAASGLALTFGANGRIVIPTRNLTPSISGSFVGEGAPIPVRQGAFASQTLTPKKMAVITTWTREMDEYSIPAIEGLLRQAVMEDTAISLDTVLLDANPATVIRPPGLRNYQAALTAAAGTDPFANFVADYKSLYGALLSLTAGNVRNPVILLNPAATLGLSLLQPTGAAAPLFPFIGMLDAGRLLRAGLIESATVPTTTAIMIDAADFVSAGAEGPRLEISDQATLHMEDTSPVDITGGTPSPATPVKSMWQTDSLALRMVMRMNWLMRRPVVAWMTGITW